MDYNHNKPNTPWEPWEEDTYRTGRTNPQKSHGGLIALLLVIIIFLVGLVSAMSVLNFRMHAKINTQADDEATMAFRQEDTQQESLQESVPQKDSSDIADSASTVPEDDIFSIAQSPESADNTLQQSGLSLQEIYQKAIPSVVSISCTGASGSSSGTGVVLSEDGYLVTNCHVVEDAQQVEVLFSDGQSLPAAIVGLDAISDLAVLYVEADGLIPAEFGDSSVLRVGDEVAAIGDPLGVELRGTLTDGIVSAINRDITTGGRTMTLIQTNAALNSGNSGGPLLNCYGQVIGINTMKIGDVMSSAGVEGLGFAIPSTTVQTIVEQLVQQGYVTGRAELGINGEAVSLFHQLYSRLPQGIYVTHVEPGSSADTTGIEVGDILLAFDGVRITDVSTLSQLLYGHQAGDTVSIVIYRSGKQYELSLTLDQAD